MSIQQIPLTSPEGVTLATARKYCRHNLQVVPKLLPMTIRQNGDYPIPDGYAGHGQITVAVPTAAKKTERHLNVFSNGVYTPGEGETYASVSVHVPVTNVIQSEHFGVKVGETFGINHDASSPTVIAPSCVRYYDDGGAIIFTAKATGAGSIYLYNADRLIGQYTVVVEPASVNTGSYTITIGNDLPITFTGTVPKVVCPACVGYRIDGDTVYFTGKTVGNGTVYLYREDLLIGQYLLRVEQLDQGDYTMRVGDQLSIVYSGSSPTRVTHPDCVSYLDDGGTLVITAKAVGSGTVCLYRGDTVIGVYRIEVTAAASTGSYSVTVGDSFEIEYESSISNLSVSCPSFLQYYVDSGQVNFTALAAGTGTIYLHHSDDLIGQYRVIVSPKETYDYDVEVGDTFDIAYESSISNLTVECPDFLESYVDSGQVTFTALDTGTGTIQLLQSDTLIGEYTIRVTEVSDSDTETEYYDIPGGEKKVGDSWVLISNEYYGQYTLWDTTGGIVVEANNNEEGLKLRAEGAGEATVIVHSIPQNMTYRYLYTVVTA